MKSVVDMYKDQAPTYNYTSPFPYDTPYGLDTNVAYTRNGVTYVSGVNASGTLGYDYVYNASTTGSSASSSSSAAVSAGSGLAVPAVGLMSMVFGVIFGLV